MTPPLVSVIIPTFDRAHLVGHAIRSVLTQTLRDLEVIVVDDGSIDATVAMVEAIRDPRIRVIRHPRNRGIPATRNTGLAAAAGRYIAWLDSDDLARPDRLAVQVAHLEAHPRGGDGRLQRGQDWHRRFAPPRRARAAADLRGLSVRGSCSAPPFSSRRSPARADVLKAHACREENGVCEDLDVFIRLARAHRIENLPAVLIDRRLHKGQTIHGEQPAIRERKLALLAPPLAQMGMRFDADDLARHVVLGNPKAVNVDAEFLGWARDWLERLRVANDVSRQVDRAGLARASAFFWLLACMAGLRSGASGAALSANLRSGLLGGLVTQNGRAWLRQALPILARGTLAG